MGCLMACQKRLNYVARHVQDSDLGTPRHDRLGDVPSTYAGHKYISLLKIQLTAQWC